MSDISRQARRNIFGLSCSQLEEYAKSIGEARFRGKQIFQWIYGKRVTDPAFMSNLSASFRQQLADAIVVQHPELSIVTESADGASKILVAFEDGAKVEAVHIPEGDRHTACLSTQVGCLVGCRFCATGGMGFTRNLKAGEIVGQLFVLENSTNTKLTNIVFMGMGEPLMNAKEVLAAIDIFTDPDSLGWSSSRITVSTMGWLPGIEALIKAKSKVKLAVSLNATTDEKRRDLMPLAGQYSIQSVLDAAHRYHDVSGQIISLGYLLLKGKNDSPEDARRLAKLVAPLPAKVNLMEYNNIGGEFHRSDSDTVEHFYQILKKMGVTVTIRNSRGSEAKAACGQLAVNAKV